MIILGESIEKKKLGETRNRIECRNKTVFCCWKTSVWRTKVRSLNAKLPGDERESSRMIIEHSGPPPDAFQAYISETPVACVLAMYYALQVARLKDKVLTKHSFLNHIIECIGTVSLWTDRRSVFIPRVRLLGYQLQSLGIKRIIHPRFVVMFIVMLSLLLCLIDWTCWNVSGPFWNARWPWCAYWGLWPSATASGPSRILSCTLWFVLASDSGDKLPWIVESIPFDERCSGGVPDPDGWRIPERDVLHGGVRWVLLHGHRQGERRAPLDQAGVVRPPQAAVIAPRHPHEGPPTQPAESRSHAPGFHFSFNL